MDSKLVAGGTYISVDNQMTFPNPVSENIAEVEWKMRHAPDRVTRGDMLLAASVIDAYKEVVARKSQVSRNKCCAAMKRAYQET